MAEPQSNHRGRDGEASHRLTITAGAGLVGSVVPLARDREISIGRDKRCAMALPSKRVQPTHCRVLYEDGEWVLRCERSSSGEQHTVIVNDGRCSEMVLCHGDRVEVGGYRLGFEDVSLIDDTPGHAVTPITLVVSSGPEAPDPRMTALAGESILIGHCDTALWQLPDRTVSRHHCRIELDDGTWIVRDLDSRNGTHLGGHAVSVGRLQHQARLAIGRYTVLVTLGG